MNIKKKILLLLTTCAMCILSVNAFADSKVVVKETGVITSDNQVFKVKAPTKENEQYYYAYTPKENGVYQFSLTVDNARFNLSPAIVTEAGDVKAYSEAKNGIVTVKYSLRAGVKIYLGLIIVSSTEKEKEVNVKISISRVESKAKFFVGDKNAADIELHKDNIKGLSWEKNTATLTIDNYTGDIYQIRFENSDVNEPFNEVIFVNVKGNNSIKLVNGIYSVDEGGSFEFIGDGELNLIFDKIRANSIVIQANEVIVDGPSINFVGAFTSPCIKAEDFVMKSGTIYLDLYPYGKEYDYTGYKCIGESDTITMESGTLILKYEEPYDNRPIFTDDVLIGKKSVDILDGTIIVTGSDKVIESRGKIAFDNKNVNISKNVKMHIGSVIDISKFKLEIIDKKLEYDKKEKKARVRVEGLKIGRDIKVEYKNNINPGKAEVIVTGIGNFKGTLKGYFEITPAVANGAAVGTIINDGKYKYKVTKSGSKNGVLIGRVSVVGLKKKSIKKIVIAKTVVIDGVTYKIISIGNKAFKKNKKIVKATIGKNVVSIGNDAFANCKKLKQVKINSKKLKKIGKKAFYKCKKLNKITIKSSKLSKVGKNFVMGTSKKLVITVPKKKKAKLVKKFTNAGFKGKVK